MRSALKRGPLSSICGLALLIGGCPKRQAPPRIVYVVAPTPAAAATSTEPPQTMVIAEPAPVPEPAEVSAPSPPPPKPEHRRRRILRTEPVPPADAEVLETPEPPAVEVPALEPRETSTEGAALRLQIQRMQADVRQRLSRFNEDKLSAPGRKTLEDARTFFTQSGRALEEGDLHRALTLARKASLLVRALEEPE